MAQMALAIAQPANEAAYRYFAAHACVFVEGSLRMVFVGGTLVSSYDIRDKATRNAILVKLSEDPKVHLGKLVEAFDLSREQLRNLQKKYEQGGLAAVMEIKIGGRSHVVTPALRGKLYELFDAGASINVARAKIKARISRTMVGRTRKAWRLERELEAGAVTVSVAPPAPAVEQFERGAVPVQGVELELLSQTTPDAEQRGVEGTIDVIAANEPCTPMSETEPSPVSETEPPAVEGALDSLAAIEISAPASQTGLVSGPSLHDAEELSSELIADGKKQYVQHAGALIVLALLQAFGLYRHAENLRQSAISEGDADRRYLGKTALRVALDAAIIALVIGQKCIEGVRRIATPSGKVLLRILSAIPSESWVRSVLGRFAKARGTVLHLTTSFALIDQAEHEHDPRAWFYVDNHYPESSVMRRCGAEAEDPR